MKSYAEAHVFTKRELKLHARAVKLVRAIPGFTVPGTNDPIRCHEIARAVGRILGLEVQDGRFGFVEHSWLWTTHFEGRLSPWVLPNVLDVYVPGSMPQVQLVHSAAGLPARYVLTSLNDLVVREDVVSLLTARMKRKAG